MIHSNRTGYVMGNLRTANKRHKRAVAEAIKPTIAKPVPVTPKKAKAAA
jgi:hypothetical protein